VQRLSGNIVDLVGRRIFPGRVEWEDGRIQRIVPEPGRRHRHFIAPGFIDAHVHIESSMLPPAEFARLAVVHGTVATVSDPHEIANVLGEAGVAYMIAEARRTPFKFCFGAPACVPATPFETAGASLGLRAVTRLLARPEIGYLSEFMDYPSVLRGDPLALAKIAAARRAGKPVDGHAPGLRGPDAAAYGAAGISTDHECFTLAEAWDKLAAGMSILIREGSAARNFDALSPLLRSDPARCMFCCDDLHPDELVRHHIDAHVRRGLAAGAHRLDVLTVASVNPVRHYGLDVGLLQVGDAADFIVFEGWRRLAVRRTYLRGRLVARDGRSLLPHVPARVVNRFRTGARRPEEFAVSAPGARRLNVIGAIEGQLITRHLRLAPRIVNGAIAADPARDILKLVVVNRYAARAPVAVAFIRGFGLRRGALASSVAHDCHNIVAVGADDASLARAVNWIIRHRGGVCAVGGPAEADAAILPLPIAGLMATGDGAAVADAYGAVDALAKRLGSTLAAPFMTLSFMALLVIPDLKSRSRISTSPCPPSPPTPGKPPAPPRAAAVASRPAALPARAGSGRR
jgi:adenine deaminase